MPALEVRNLSKNFGALPAVNNVSFTVERGQRWAIIGPNGAGKTTLFNLLNGLISPTSGQVYLFSQNVTHLPIHRRIALGLGRTFQVTSLMPDLTVLDNILLAIQALKPYRFSMFRPQSTYHDLSDEARILLEQWNLWERRDILIRNLSYGERPKVELIMALASKPKLLLLDEPTSGMNLAETEAIMAMIKNLERDITILLIAHDMDLVFGLDLDHITVLHYGQIVAEGMPQEIKADPRVREIYLGTIDEA